MEKIETYTGVSSKAKRSLIAHYPEKCAQSMFLLTQCESGTQPFKTDRTQSELILGADIAGKLLEFGGDESDIGIVFSLGISDVHTLGFPQGSYNGTIIVRIR